MLSVRKHARRLAALPICAAVTVLAAFSDPAAAACLPGVLQSRLAQIKSQFGPLQVISTFRKGAQIAGSRRASYHASCRAVDFKPPAGKYQAVVKWLEANHPGGIGTYSCGMHHIHIDSGPRVRFHHCVTASGRPTSRQLASRPRTTRIRSALAVTEKFGFDRNTNVIRN